VGIGSGYATGSRSCRMTDICIKVLDLPVLLSKFVVYYQNKLKNIIRFSSIDHFPHKDCIICSNNIFIFSSIAENSYNTELADVLFRIIE
jgi:hypothetical protein